MIAIIILTIIKIVLINKIMTIKNNEIIKFMAIMNNNINNSKL